MRRTELVHRPVERGGKARRHPDQRQTAFRGTQQSLAPQAILIGIGLASRNSSGINVSRSDQERLAPRWSLAIMRSNTKTKAAVSRCAEATMPPPPPCASIV